MARKLLITVVVALLIFLVFALCRCSRVEKEEETKVTAKVVEKEYRAAYSSYIPMRVGKVTTVTMQRHPEKYYITVQYEDITETFDDEEWYNLVEEGEAIDVILYRGYSREGELLKKELFLIDN
ncbi:MAG: hypothetical protein IJO08_00460 [Clostridia bacterium]|nr:hypothetical protein [Clostridia bacterium]